MSKAVHPSMRTEIFIYRVTLGFENKLVLHKARAVASKNGYKILDDQSKQGWSYRTFISPGACSLSETEAMQRWIVNARDGVKARQQQITDLEKRIAEAEEFLLTLQKGGAQ